MKFRLKNKVLQKRLDDISLGAFSKRLADIEALPSSDVSLTLETDVFSTVITLKGDALEESKYDPTGWNNFPDVIPPHGEAMEVSTVWTDNPNLDTIERLVWDDPRQMWVENEENIGYWADTYMHADCVRELNLSVYFRPWIEGVSKETPKR